jgi:hypothetical protein
VSPLQSAQVFPCPQLIFPSKTWCFRISIWIFSGRYHLKNQYLPHSGSKSYQINYIKSCASRSFSNNTKETFQFLQNFELWFYFAFQWKNHSIFKNFCTTSPSVMEPSPCTHPCQELSKDTKKTICSIPLQWIYQTKLTTFLHIHNHDSQRLDSGI